MGYLRPKRCKNIGNEAIRRAKRAEKSVFETRKLQKHRKIKQSGARSAPKKMRSYAMIPEPWIRTRINPPPLPSGPGIRKMPNSNNPPPLTSAGPKTLKTERRGGLLLAYLWYSGGAQNVLSRRPDKGISFVFTAFWPRIPQNFPGALRAPDCFIFLWFLLV